MFPGKTNGVVSATIMQQAEQEESRRIDRIRRAWRAYNYEAPMPLKANELDKEGKDNARLNLARKTVNTSAYYLFGKGFDIEIGENAGEEDSPTEKWLEKAWKSQHQGMVPFLLELAQGAGIEGDAFVRLYPPDKARGEEIPRLVPLSAEMTRAECEPADHTRVRRYIIEWSAIDTAIKKSVAYRHTIQYGDIDRRWTIVEEHSVGDNPAWVLDQRTQWPHRFPPIFHCKNLPWPHSFYGASDIEDDVLQLNDAINFVVSNLNRILRAYGHPFDYVTGQRLDEVKRDIGAMPYFPNPDAKINRLPEIENLTAADEQFQRLRQAYDELTSIPQIASGKVDNIGQLSGLALQILYGPLVAMIQTKREFWEPMLQGLSRAMLVVGGEVAEDATLDIEIKWPSILPANRKEEAETATALNDAGVSQDTTLKEMGYDPEQEKAKKAQEGADAASMAAKLFDRGGLPGDPGSSGDGTSEDGSTGGGN
jgi:hypothetical protein